MDRSLLHLWSRLLHPWDFPGHSTGVGCHSLLPKNLLEPTKTRYSTSTDKEATRRWQEWCNWDKIKSHACRVGDPQLDNYYTTEVLSQQWKFWAPCQVSQPESPAMTEGAHRESGFEGQQGLISEIAQGWGRQNLHSWRKHIRSHAHQDPGLFFILFVCTGSQLQHAWSSIFLVACGIFSYSMQNSQLQHVGSSFLTRDWTWVP